MNEIEDMLDEKRKDDLIDQLIQFGVYEGLNNQQLYELSLPELERMHEDVRGVAVNE